MYVSTEKQESYSRWAGNARFINLSNTFIVAHVAQAALMMLWAGVFTLFELAVYSADEPLYTQGLILLPHLAAQGWGVSSGGDVSNTFTWFAIGVIHIVAAGVSAAGAYFHRSKLPASLGTASGNALKFDFDWGNAQKLGFILGHHLVILGFGALLLVAKAKFFGGLYDANLGEVRLVESLTLDPGTIWDYKTHLFDVNSLEDLVGGHVYVAVLLILGGVWHIVVPPFQWVERVFIFSADGILSYSLFGLALAGFAASYYCGFNALAYPEAFYGPTLELKSAFLPRYFEAQPSLSDGYTTRVWLANAHFYLAFFFLQGGLWHYQQARGFDIASLLENWRQNMAFSSDNPTLAYQQTGLPQPLFMPLLQYGLPQSEPAAWLKQKQPFEEYVYCQSQGIERPSLTALNGVETTLYQTTFQTQKDTFYQSSQRTDRKGLVGYNREDLTGLYGRSKAGTRPAAYAQPIATVFYEPKHSNHSNHHRGSGTATSTATAGDE